MSSSARAKWLKSFNDREDYPFKAMDNSSLVFCKVCEKSFAGTKKSTIQQHVATERHQKNSQLKSKRSQTQAQLEEVLKATPKKSKSELLGRELCSVFLAANIPWNKLEHPRLKAFLEAQTGLSIPNEATLRTNYMQSCYEEVMQAIREDLHGADFWVSTDETQDAVGRNVVNVILGKLDCEKYHIPYLVKCSFLEKCDSSEVSRLLNDTLRWLFPLLDTSQAKVLITDAATYMIKSGKDLSIFFPFLVHATCLAHALHRVCEKVREIFEDVKTLISSTKKVFLKAPERRSLYKESYPNLPFPPEPVVTR